LALIRVDSQKIFLLNPQFLFLFFHGLDLGLFPFLDLDQELFVLFQALLQALDMVDQTLIGRIAVPIAALELGSYIGKRSNSFILLKNWQPILSCLVLYRR